MATQEERYKAANDFNSFGKVGQAFPIWKALADEGYAPAQFNVGFCYRSGNPVPKDYAKAVEWYLKAAEQGEASAQNNLGYHYYNGLGISQDYAKAAEWYGKAAAQGYAGAKEQLDKLKAEGKISAGSTAPQSPQNITANANQMKDILEQANALMEHNPDKALELYQKAANLGSGEALFVLYSVLDQEDDNDPQTKNAANVYLHKAAEAGYADAQFILACNYETGEGVQKNVAEAAKWYLKAAEQGYSDAQYGIGSLLCFGEGIEKDKKEGLKWLSKASNQGHANAKKYLDEINNAKIKRNVGIAGSIAKAVIEGLGNAIT